jgi:hypothetical protein
MDNSKLWQWGLWGYKRISMWVLYYVKGVEVRHCADGDYERVLYCRG